MQKQRFATQYLRAIARTEAALAAYADSMLATDQSLNLTFSQYLILNAIAQGAVTQADVARDLAISNAATSRHMSILHTRGYITRYVKDDERRAHVVTLTKKGAAKRRLADNILTKALQQPLKPISASSRTSILKTLVKTVKLLRAM